VEITSSPKNFLSLNSVYMKNTIIFTMAFIGFMMNGCAQKTSNQSQKKLEELKDSTNEIATFGAGCFWCVEAIFQQIPGVKKVVSGYSGGQTDKPTYKEVCNGTTGHAEVCQITYDPTKVSFETLLSVFWQTHDPTTMNRQGEDVGTQYRSAVFYHNEQQKELAEKYKKELNESHAFENPVVTEITAFTNFYSAEDYHQNYFNQNGDAPYCRFVVAPKVEKFRKVFKDKLQLAH
jgi:peptide-methionine (S)-S-oxide reductase